HEGFNAAAKMEGISFAGCRFEKNGAADIKIDPPAGNFCYGVDVRGGYFDTDSPVPAPIEFGGRGGAVRGFSVQGNFAKDYTTAFVRLNGEGQSGIVTGNKLTMPLAVSSVRPGVLAFNNEGATAIEPTWNPPAKTAAYKVTNPAVNRSLDASAATPGDVRQVL